MNKHRDSSSMYMVPASLGYASMVLPGASQTDLPPVDDHVVEPETREELLDGRVVHAAPAGPPHGDRHSELDYVLRANVAAGYVSSTDLLTRTSDSWNFAADASIRKQGFDPDTGHRYLEELAFEIKHTQSMSELTARASELARRGVRRVFVVCVGARPGDVSGRGIGVMEWSVAEERWIELAASDLIKDRCLRCPIQVRALLDAAEADNAVARALLTRANPVLEDARHEAEARGYERGSVQALREAIVDLCELLEVELTPARLARIETLDAAGLRALRQSLKTRRRWDE